MVENHGETIAALTRPSNLFRVVEEKRIPSSKTPSHLGAGLGFLSPSSPSDKVEGQRQELGSIWMVILLGPLRGWKEILHHKAMRGGT